MMDENEINKENINNETPDLSYKDKKEVLKGGLVGAFIGLAVIVPGVSGSVAAIILKLYEKLLYALGNLFKEFKKCLKFLLPIAIGGVIGIVLAFFGVKALLNILPFAIVALFAGLMFGSFPAVSDQLKGEKITPWRVVLFIIGLCLPIALSTISIFLTEGTNELENMKFYHYILFVLFGYLVAVTQLVPGLSATALMMIFGWFTPIVNSISITYWGQNPMVFVAYLCLGAGFIAGLFTVSKWLSRLLEKFRAPSFFAIAGLSLGSTISMFYNPDVYSVYTNWAESGVVYWELALGIALFILGIAAAYAFVRYERKHGK